MLGSNLEPEAHVARALDALTWLGALHVGSVVRTAPWGDVPGPFVNVAVIVDEPPQPLRPVLKAIETSMGRVRGAHASARHAIDIDIIAWLPAVNDTDGIRDATDAITKASPPYAQPLLAELFAAALACGETPAPPVDRVAIRVAERAIGLAPCRLPSGRAALDKAL